MALPLQVQRQVELANKLFDQANGPAGDPATPQEPVNPAPQIDEPVVPPNSEAVPPVPAEPVAAPVPPVAPDWEQKYRTLQGVFSAESNKLKAANQELERKVNDLATQVQELKATPKPTAPPADANDIATYGPEMLDLIERRASEIVAQQLATLTPQLEQTRAQVAEIAQTQYRSEADEFYGELKKAVPDWEQINADEQFIGWLAEVDPMFGVPRQQAMNHAGKTMNHAQAASLFNGYKTAFGLNQPAAAAPAPVPRPQVSPSPRTVGASSAPSMREPETSVKKSEISAHYARASREPGYKNSEAYKTFEKRMEAALAANKIIEA